MTDVGWAWDPSLYAGSAPYYARGRVAYPSALVDELRAALRLDGSGRLLDVGCGPGSLTLPLAGLFEQAVGVDADPGMLAEASRLAEVARVRNCRWRQLRGEDLPAELGTFRLISFAQSFHWMDRVRVAEAVHGMIEPGGALIHVHATTHQGIDDGEPTPHPRPPRQAIAELVREYLGPVRRAGQGALPTGTPGGEVDIYPAAGFSGPRGLKIPGQLVTRTTDDVVASMFSLSSSTPNLFGDRLPRFEADLRKLLTATNPSGLFSEAMRETRIDVWTP